MTTEDAQDYAPGVQLVEVEAKQDTTLPYRSEEPEESFSSVPEIDDPEREARLEKLEQDRLHIEHIWELCKTDPHQGSPGSNYDRYDLCVDHNTGDRAMQIKLFSLRRPHMRALHCAWLSFFLAFVIWVSPAPLLKEIQGSLGLSKKQVWTSSITNDATAIIMRIIMGPVCDAYGARIPMASVLVAASIPTAMLGLVNTAAGLAVIRFFIGIAGSSFGKKPVLEPRSLTFWLRPLTLLDSRHLVVMSQYWPSRMFATEIAGTANGIVGGWGNLGGAVSQLLMGRILLPAFTSVYNGNRDKAWRTIPVIPASIAFIWGFILPFVCDDAPTGNYVEMRKKGTMDRIIMTTSLKKGATRNTWILYVQYACCFGVELAMNNAAVLYFTSEFNLTTEQASTLGFAYGSMNIFARALGGLFSDRLNLRMGMRGRLWLQTVLLVMEGVLIIAFSCSKTLAGAVVTMCIFSIFTQSAEGAIYGVVPYVSKLYTGSVAGLVGSGGNVGSVVYGFLFRSLPYRTAFLLMGSIVVASSSLSLFIRIPCHAGLIWGEDNHAVIQARQRFLQRQLEQQAEQAHSDDATPQAQNRDQLESRDVSRAGSVRSDEEESAPPEVLPS
jgi:NNP family nitrate/nitrite transporter-like MFS transporter